MNAKVIAHCLVGNEERFIWYTLKSALPFVDKIMIWDTGSTDRTVEIIKSIKNPKIELKLLGPVDAAGHTKVREQMLAATDKHKYRWLLILDGDEIWPEEQLRETLKHLLTTKANAVAVATRNFVGDIYHRLPESAGRYKIKNKTGHFNLRFIDLKTPNLKISNPHGAQTYTSNGIALQNQSDEKLDLLDTYYYHATHLPRSSQDKQTLKRAFKKKYSLGIPIARQQLPKIFFTAPKNIPQVTQKAPLSFWLIAVILMPIKLIKRILLPAKSGY
jgi:glycosyltransferase involved in cell wall biosynthesis